MQIAEVVKHLEQIAPPSLQESYDNSGLLIGEQGTEITGVLIGLDCVESTIEEAIAKNCNLVVVHHPIIFSGLKRFNNSNYVQRTVQSAIKNDIAIYAIHTNLDNVYHQGVNQKIASKLGLQNTTILSPKAGHLLKLVTYVPTARQEEIKDALFAAGAGHIGNYSECSFSLEGTGSYKGNEASKPTMGEKGKRHYEKEAKVEVILRMHQKGAVLNALMQSHPYEEVAYEIYPTLNADTEVGSGMVGELKDSLKQDAFLKLVKDRMGLDVIKYTPFQKEIKRIAICGGSGQFLLGSAKKAKADVLVTSDFKYHQYFDAEGELMICDIGHYESEKFTIDLLYDILTKKFSNFAVLKTEGVTNPVKYFL
jgi:dinuclear metal center YbgI/SA1388 family protein